MRRFIIAVTTFISIVLLSCTNDSESEKIPDVTAPTVAFSIAGMPNTPEDGIVVVSTLFVVNVEAKDEGGIAKVEAFINDEKVGEESKPPYSITIDLTSFVSKVGKTEGFDDYILKIIVTDSSGNSSSKDQNIRIDAQLPSITNVSITNGLIIGGGTNPVTFDVRDNEELSSVLVYMNDVIIANINDKNYELNIDTANLNDGDNNFKIEVKDIAGNIGSHSVQFIVDNSGPEITLEAIQDGQLIDQLTTLDPSILDAYSDIRLVEIFYDDRTIFSTDEVLNVKFDFDPENYPAGEAILKIKAVDILGNANEVLLNVNVLRLLFTLNIPEGYLSPNISINHFLFASELDGNLIDMKEIIFETGVVKLYATGEFELGRDFTITFASLGRNGVASYLNSFSHINRQNLNEMTLVVPNRYSGSSSSIVSVNGFSDSTQLFGYGRDYHFSSTQSGERQIQSFVPSNHMAESGPIYIYGFNPLNNFYNYRLLDRPIPANLEINFSDLSVENLVEKELRTNPEEFINSDRYFTLYGFRNQQDLDNDLYHNIWSYGYGQYIRSPFKYKLNTEFYEYAYELNIGNYREKGIGLPKDIIVVPNWSIDYTFENKIVSLTKSGTGHIVGSIYLEGGYDVSAPYEWNVFFDSNKDGNIALPKIPIVLQNYPIYNHYQNNYLEVVSVGLRKYDNMETYESFLEQTLKGNKAFQKSCPPYQSIFTGERPQSFSSPGYFYTWW